MACSIWSLSSSSVCGFEAYSVFFKFPQMNKSKGVKSGDQGGNSVALPLRPIHLWLNVRSRNFKLVSDSYYCYPCWWCTKLNPPTSLNFNNILQHSPFCNNTLIITCVHRMIISPPCLFKHIKNDERVAMLFQCLLDHAQHKLYFCLISLLKNNVSKSAYINLRHCVAWAAHQVT